MNWRVSESDEEGLRSFVLPSFGGKKIELIEQEGIPSGSLSAKDRLRLAGNNKGSS